MKWSNEQDEILEAMVAAGARNAAIGQVLGQRSAATINQRKIAQGLIVRPTECRVCGGRIQKAERGRPGRYCSKLCTAASRQAKDAAQRAATRAAAIEAREIWVCEGCSVQLPHDDPKVRYCSPACMKRTTEARYKADGRRGAQGRRVVEKRRKEAALRPPRIRTEMVEVITAMDDAGQPNDLAGYPARVWVRRVAGLSVRSEKICAAVKLRRSR